MLRKINLLCIKDNTASLDGCKSTDLKEDQLEHSHHPDHRIE